MTEIHKRLLVDGKKLDANIVGRIMQAIQTRTMEGAASLTITVDDYDGLVLQSGLLAKDGSPSKRAEQQNLDQAAWDRFAPARVSLDGWFTRLAGVSLAGTTLTLTFEDEIATLMRHRTEPVKSTRHTQGVAAKYGVTRASFIRDLMASATSRLRNQQGDRLQYSGRFFSPEQDIAQPTKKPEKSTVTQKGFEKNAKLTIKGVAADDTQKRHLAAALEVADDLLASDLATLALICAGIGESDFTNVVNSLGFGGVFQGAVSTTIHPENWFAPMGPYERTREEAKSFLLGGRGYGAGGAIAYAKANPNATPGQVAVAVEVSDGAVSYYDKWVREAEKIIEAWGGVSQIVTTRRKYSYRAGGKRNHKQHNYWDDAGDLAREVNWRLFADANILSFVSDEWLFTRQPIFTVNRGDSEIIDVSFQADIGVPVAEVIVSALAPRWQGAPGAVVEIGGYGPIDGRWLIWQHDHDLFTGQDTFTLHRPAPKYKEPAPEKRVKTISPASNDVTDSGLVYPLAEHGTDLGGVAAHKARAWGNWQSDNAVDIGVPIGTAVYAVDSGTIIRLTGSYDGTGASNPNGYNITLQTKNNQWFYTHLSHREPLHVGQKVQAGALFGKSGAANSVQHLHIACLKGDPESLLGVKDS
jgi:hypothetical protein